MPNGTGNFRNFQISRKKDNLERWTKIFEMNFRKISVPFDFEPEFSEILVEWNAPLFFWKFGNSGNVLFHLAFLPGLNRPQFLKSWKATRWRRFFRVDTTLDAKWSAIVRTYSWSKTKTSDFLENYGLAIPNFLWVSSPSLHTLPREKFVSFSHNYQGRVEFRMCVKLFHMKQLNTALKTATSSGSSSIFLCNSWWEMCSSGNWTRSVRPGGKYRSIRQRKFRKLKPEFLVEWNAPFIYWALSIRPKFPKFPVRNWMER